MQEEMARKRKQQFSKLVRFRQYQMGGLLGALFFYLFVYRRYLVAAPVLHCVVGDGVAELHSRPSNIVVAAEFITSDLAASAAAPPLDK